MKKVIVLFLAVLMLVATVSASYAWDRGGRHNHDYGRHHNYGHHRYNYWRDFGATMAIIGGAAIAGAIINAPYYNQSCRREIRYGHWEYNSYGRYWVTTHIEYEPVPCY